MNSQTPFESGLYKIPLLEQAMGWLVANGPLIDRPELRPWILKRLVAQKRILRLRKGLYLVPSADGTLLPFPALAGLLAPEGHVSFYAALILHGLTDQDTRQWVVVTPDQQATVSYGPRTMTFFPSPSRCEGASTTTLDVRGTEVRVATAAQAFSDTLLFPRHGPDLPEMLHILRSGLTTGRLSRDELLSLVERENSPALARRVGFLLEVATNRTDERLFRLAHRTNDRTQAWPGKVQAVDYRWRLALPASRELIAYGARL